MRQWRGCHATNRFWRVFGELQRNLPFTFGRLIGPYGGIFGAEIFPAIYGVCSWHLSKHYDLLRVFPHLQQFVTTNLMHSTFVMVTLLLCSSCACSSRHSFIIHWNETVRSLYGCTLQNIPIISKNASNKSCIELNFLQKTVRKRIFIYKCGGARVLQRLAFLKYYNALKWESSL